MTITRFLFEAFDCVLLVLLLVAGISRFSFSQSPILPIESPQESKAVVVKSAVIPTPAQPAAPVFVSCVQEGKSVKLQWTTAREDVQAFQVMRLQENGQVYSKFTLGQQILGSQPRSWKKADGTYSWTWVDSPPAVGFYQYAVIALFYDADSAWAPHVRINFQQPGGGGR